MHMLLLRDAHHIWKEQNRSAEATKSSMEQDICIQCLRAKSDTIDSEAEMHH